MKTALATAAVILDTRRKKIDSTFPLKLRITYQRIRKYYNVGVDLTLTQWQDVEDKTKTRRELREVRERISDFERRAEKTIRELATFSFSAFEATYFRDHKQDIRQQALQNDLIYAFTNYIEQLSGEGRAATAESYSNALTSLTAFRKKLKFDEITPEFLKSYEKYMLLAGRSTTTIGIYLRSLRTIMNQVIAQGAIKVEQYPFGKHRYQIPGSRNVKKALTLAEIEKIFHYQAIAGSQEEKARDFWVFSYLCNGINMKDICRLKWKNIDGDKIKFIRAKTSRTSKSNQRPVLALLTDHTQEVIRKWGNSDKKPDGYIFPFLTEGVTAERERELVQYATKFINKWMRRIATNLSIDKPVTTYFARHSFATILKRSGAPIEFISESLGHNDLKTTESYLDSFEDDVKREYTKALLNFN